MDKKGQAGQKRQDCAHAAHSFIPGPARMNGHSRLALQRQAPMAHWLVVPVVIPAMRDGELLSGRFPPKKHKLVVAWIEIHREDLEADWQLAANGRKPFPIRGLDQ